MKLDDRKKETMVSKRTLKLFEEAFIVNLEKKPFEKISVSDICTEAMIPRATFYNYFEDKYDLLEYFCGRYMEDTGFVSPEEGQTLEDYLNHALDKLLMFLQKKNDIYRQVYITNENGYFMNYMRNFIKKRLANLMATVNYDHRSSMPLDLKADLMAGMIVSLCIWWIYHSNEVTIAEVHQYFRDVM